MFANSRANFRALRGFLVSVFMALVCPEETAWQGAKCNVLDGRLRAIVALWLGKRPDAIPNTTGRRALLHVSRSTLAWCRVSLFTPFNVHHGGVIQLPVFDEVKAIGTHV